MNNPYRKRPRTESSSSSSSSSTHISNCEDSTNEVKDPIKEIINEHAAVIPEKASNLIISAADKAGMDGIDRAAIDAIILKESGNSLFMQEQRRRDDRTNARIACFREKLAKIERDDPEWRRLLQQKIDTEIPNWLASRPKRSVKVVIDMDAFYMNCELLSRPDITDETPACVGGPSMIMTSNYAARRYGVRSAMPGFIGEALVRQISKGREKLVFCSPNFTIYKEKAQEMRHVVSAYDPNVCAYSLDEVYLDLGAYLVCSLDHPDWTHEQIATTIALGCKVESSLEAQLDEVDYGAVTSDKMNDHYVTSAGVGSIASLLSYTHAVCLARIEAIVSDIRDRIRSATGGLTCSAGIAPNFLLAKIASDKNKPNGQLVIPSEHEYVKAFINTLPIRTVSGIGRVTEKILNSFGITTVEQLFIERALIRLFFESTSTASFLLRASVGCSSSDGKVLEDDASSSHQKGMSRERTMQPGKSWPEIIVKFEEIGRLLSRDMEQKKLLAQTITVKIKLSTFECLSRSRSLPHGVFVQSASDLLQEATELLQEIRHKEMNSINPDKSTCRALFSLRLLGIRCSNLVDESDNRLLKSCNQVKIDRFFQHLHQTFDVGLEKEEASPPKNETFEKRLIGEVINPYSPHIIATGNSESCRNATTRTTDAATFHDTESSALCPVCGVLLYTVNDNDTLNRHIDACLNGNMVRQAIAEESARVFHPQRRKKTTKPLTDFFCLDMQHNCKDTDE